jgi:hypothetical protein
MAAASNIKDILTQVKQLPKEDQVMLLHQLAYLVKGIQTKKTGALRLQNLSGLGSEIWKNTDEINQYIDAERQW